MKQWPPEKFRKQYTKFAEWSAWYSGDPNQIAKVYSNSVFTPTKRGRFWAKKVKQERQTMLHVPVAGDIASVSANLVTGEEPKITIPQAHMKNASNDSIFAQKRLDTISRKIDLQAKLVEASETASALGGVYLKVNWDKDFKPFPMLSVAQPDNAIPEFKWGYLSAVTFHKIIETDGTVAWRLLERHEPGKIFNSLYKGSLDQLGVRQKLSAHPATQGLRAEIDTKIDNLAVVYIPNQLPNKLWRGSNLGLSDYSGTEGLMDALDEVYTSWMRDLRIARSRIIVPESFLETEDGEFVFDVDQDVFVKMNMGPPGSKEQQITMNQFDIRSEQHRDTALELFEKIISSAGYSPQTFGLKIMGRAESGTALKLREKKSFNTQKQKRHFFKSNLEQILYVLLQIDKAHFTPSLKVYRPKVDFKDKTATDPVDLATSVEKIERAHAASIETKVRWLHPDWNDDQVQHEVDLIKEERGNID